MANMNFGVNILPKADNTYSLGNSNYKWNIYANTINGTTYIDTNLLAPKNSPIFTNSVSMGRAVSSTSGANSTALGTGVIASGASAHAEGDNTTASASSSHAEGYGSTASSSYTHAEGYQTAATGNIAHSEGYMTVASGVQSHAEGSTTTASGISSHAEGSSTTASNVCAHAEGGNSIASGDSAHAEGSFTQACGGASHTEGMNTIAKMSLAHAEGYATIAAGQMSHTEGRNTIASGWLTHVGGKYNVYETANAWTANTAYEVDDKVLNDYVLYRCKTAHTSGSSFEMTNWQFTSHYLVQIGNGTADDARSNAYALTFQGDGHYNGNLYVNCNTDSTGGSKVATESYVTTAIANASLNGGSSISLATVATTGDYSDLINKPTAFTGATSSVAGSTGLVPAPTTSDINKFLRGDGTWASVTGGITGITLVSTSLIPSNGVVTIPAMTACSSSSAGATGAVPAPAAGDEDKFLSGDGTWKAGGLPMVILSYGNSTWSSFINAYNNNVIVYTRASSNSNPATGSQTRMAFMAYVNDATNPTNVEFQYYRSVNPTQKSVSQMCDQVFIYKLDKNSGWSVTTREASIKTIEFGSNTGLSASFNGSTGKLTISAT